jgi:hypothetical protein
MRFRRPAGLDISREATEDAYLLEIRADRMDLREIRIEARGGWILVATDSDASDVRAESFDQGRGFSRSYSFSTGTAQRRFRLPPDADAASMTRQDGEDAIRIRIPRRRE